MVSTEIKRCRYSALVWLHGKNSETLGSKWVNHNHDNTLCTCTLVVIECGVELTTNLHAYQGIMSR